MAAARAGPMTVRYVHQRASDSALAEAEEGSSRVELDLPALAPRCAGCLDLRAALTAGSSSQTDSGLNSRVSGRVGLIDDAVLTGETQLGLTGAGRAGVARPTGDDGDAGRPGDTSPALLRLPHRRTLPPRPGVRSAHLAARQPGLVGGFAIPSTLSLRLADVPAFRPPPTADIVCRQQQAVEGDTAAARASY